MEYIDKMEKLIIDARLDAWEILQLHADTSLSIRSTRFILAHGKLEDRFYSKPDIICNRDMALGKLQHIQTNNKPSVKDIETVQYMVIKELNSQSEQRPIILKGFQNDPHDKDNIQWFTTASFVDRSVAAIRRIEYREPFPFVHLLIDPA